MIERKSNKFGLPECLWVPIAADSIDSIEKYVGKIKRKQIGKSKTVEAVLVQSAEQRIVNNPRVKLWKEPKASEYQARLFPTLQVWVHVDYGDYRQAYCDFGMPAIPADYVLDHVQNRKAIRLRDYSHSYLRLCPVSRSVNSSGGHRSGGEGMEKDYLKSVKKASKKQQPLVQEASSCSIIYADPMDLTKMLDIPPGTTTLRGVQETQGLFFPR